VLTITRESLHGLVDKVDGKNIEKAFLVLMSFLPEVEPLPDEIEVMREFDEKVAKHGTARHDAVCYSEINWD